MTRRPPSMPEPTHPPTPPGVSLTGFGYAFFAYDAGLAIDLAAASLTLGEARHRQITVQRRRAAPWLAYEPAPLCITHRLDRSPAGPFAIDPDAECTLFDFGAISVRYRVPIAGRPGTLPALADFLYDNDDLLADSRRRVEEICGALGDAIAKPRLAHLVEDYTVLAVHAWSPACDASELLDREGDALARAVLAEPGGLSPGHVEEALASRASFTRRDAVIVGFDAAVVLDPEPSDVLAVLEHANVELAEMRLLDQQLDLVLERSYRLLQEHGTRRFWPGGPGSHHLRRLAELQMDNAILFENVNNAIKLVGDQYLARVYRLAGARLHLPEWDQTILRKLETAESIYQKIVDAQTARRMELLEIIIVLLIAVSLILPFLPIPGH